MFSPQVATKSFLRVVASALKNEQFDCGSRSPHRVSFGVVAGRSLHRARDDAIVGGKLNTAFENGDAAGDAA